MALASTSAFASFDINSNTNILDISSVLAEALILDFNLLNDGISVALDDPVEDTTFSWNEEALNSDVVQANGSLASDGTSLVVDTGHGARTHIGDLLKNKAAGSDEVLQVTAISTDTLTVTRGYNSTTAAAIADNAVLAVMPAFQEMSDWSADKSVKPTAESNVTQILFAGDLGISRSQQKRKMATIALDVDRQLANRAIELRRYWTTTALYSEASSSAGSDSVYRTTRGMRSWIEAEGGVTDTDTEALSKPVLDAANKSAVDLGRYVDTLAVGTDLVDSISGIESSARRLVESDRQVGYTVQRILLAQGNEVDVIVDGRVHTGDAFMWQRKGQPQVRLRPLVDSAMFVIAATNFEDGVKRRIGSEMGLEFRQAASAVYLSKKT